ncbi:MAG: XamI family restriction endonuclease [Thermodesulfobacteriota bacterium]|nr:XamI family restriction endonuclease [Thermodesulfobacteriota bacterium]
MSLSNDLKVSREYEMKTYLSSMDALYDNAIISNGEIYDIASSLTNKFSNINAEAVLTDSRIIKTLRYSVAPTISQMKFGQFFGINSIGKFENDKLSAGTENHKALKKIADSVAKFATDNLDKSRFIWIDAELSKSEKVLASEYAKKWTCSLAADQNAQTKYRNWRKDQQEHAVAGELVKMGYVKSTFTGIVSCDTDINVGEYTQELKVQGRTRQKADLIVRSKKTRKLVLIEAKAVGVEIDSTKRIKECCDKSNDWRAGASIGSPDVITVIAGFFTETGIKNLTASNVSVVWEHRLKDLSKLL